MKYSMVKQFSNSALDNAFNFIFRWVDFGKVMIEVVIIFLSIWQAFLAVFYNIFMYFYYLILFFIDRGSEEGVRPRIFQRPISGRLSSMPALDLKTIAPPPSGMASAARVVAETAVSAASSIPIPQKSPAGGQKKGVLKTMGESVVAFFLVLTGAFKKLGILISEFLSTKFKPVKEDDDEKTSGKGSLIDEYLREYERQRK